MYTISNQTRAEIIKLLEAIATIPGSDTRTANIRRKAKLNIKKLTKAKPL